MRDTRIVPGSRIARSLALLLALVLAGCSVDGGSGPTSAPSGPLSAPTPSSAPTPTPTRSSATPSPRATPSAATYTMPLALVVHATRPTADVEVAEARRVAARGATRWSAIGQPGGRMRVASFPDLSAREVLRQVRASRGVLGLVPASAVDARVRALTVGGQHPLRAPRAYPLEVDSPTPVPRVTTVTMVGDIMLARRVGQAIASDPERPFRPLAKRLAGADVTVGNLESTLSTDGSPTQGGDSFGARPRVLRGLESAGFDLVSLANNHVGDYGDRAMRQTFTRLRAADLDYVGAGRTLAEARRPVVITRDGVRIGFLGTESIGETPAAGRDRAGTNRLNMPPRTGPMDRAALRRIAGDIRRLKRQVDVAVVIPHWGTQYTHRAESSQRTAARAFAAAGADLVIGGHPHWVQGWGTAGSGIVVH